MNTGNPHVLVLPYPVPGHIIPLMDLARTLAKHGFKITFANTVSSHEQVMNTLVDKSGLGENFHLVLVPDNGVEARKLEEVITRINESEDYKITCIIADQSLGWAMEVGEKMNIKRVAFLPAAAATLVLGFSIPKLIEDGVINEDGTIAKDEMIQFSPSMPVMKTINFVWARIGNLATQKYFFGLMVRNNKSVKSAEYLICNSAKSLEPGAFAFAPEILPIGPLLACQGLGNSPGQFWPQDSMCPEWLDQQAKKSVIYVAFGSHTLFNQTQFRQLALGLELTNRPFLWVVRPDIVDKIEDAYPEGYLERVPSRGKIVKWTPQRKVLSHESIGCFLSHCGWNSTIEGVNNGIPFLCWPDSADQFINESYICDVWKVGLNFEKDGRGIVTKEEIRNKAEQLFSDMSFKLRAKNLKKGMVSSMSEDGNSFENFKNLIEWMKL